MGKIESYILSKIILLQSTMHIMQEDMSMVRFIFQGLSKIPGIHSLCVFIRNNYYSGDKNFSPDKKKCEELYTFFTINTHTQTECDEYLRNLKKEYGRECLLIKTIFDVYGFLFLDIADKAAFSTVRPYIENTLNVAALVIENNTQKQMLLKNQENLEKIVAQRTKKLRESEERFRALAQSSRDGIIVYNKEMNYIYWNKAMETISGLKEEEILGQSAFKVFPFLEEVGEAEAFRGVLEGKTSFSQPMPYFIPQSGKHGWFISSHYPIYDSRGGIKGGLAIVNDITQQRIAEQELHFTQFSIDNCSDAIFWIKGDGSLNYVNDSACKKLGYTREEILGMKIMDIDITISRESWKKHWQEIKEKKTFQYDSLLQAKDGHTFPVEMVVNYTKFGELEYDCVFVRDISERKKAEEEKKAIIAQLNQAQKMEAIGTLAGGIAHDFNNILAIIIMHTELVLDMTEKMPQVHSFLSKSLQASLRARELIKQILDFSRKSKPEMKPIPIAPLIIEALILIRASIPTSIMVYQSIENFPDKIMCNPTQINQILLNFCSNASQAMNNEGVLRIDLTKTTINKNEPPHVQDLLPGEYAVLSVSDTGCGIPPEHIRKIYDPYFTTKDMGKGSGLGLSVVYGIVKSHNGIIRLESEINKGTTFRVFFPITTESSAILPEENHNEEIGGKEAILFIDDEEMLAEAAHHIISALGYTIDCMTDPVKALEHFRSHPDKYSLIITDMTMPNLPGNKLCGEILKVRPEMRIILCSGYNEDIDTTTMKDLGVARFIMKPFTKTKLAEVIRDVLDNHK